MNPIARSAFPSFRGMIDTISELNEVAFSSLLGEIRSSAAFDTDTERMEGLAAQVGGTKEALSMVVSGLAFLYRQLRVARETNADLKTLLPEIIESIAGKDLASSAVVDRLATLLAANEHAEEWEKLQRLRKGFLNNAVEFSTLVDARPNFSRDKTQLLGFVPVIQLRITTDREQPSERTAVFQLDPRSLKKLRDALDIAEMKLDLLVSHPGISDGATS